MNSYKPISVFGLNDQGHSIQYHMYDATGNLVVDKYSGSTFRVGPRGLPVESRVYGSVDLPANLTVAQVESGSTFPNEKQRVEMGYDETGARAWRKVTDMATGSVRIEATVPGVGTYMQDDNGAWSLRRLELVEGGFRPDGNGAALFAVSDAQGNVRGYAQKNGGLVSAYGYTPYGQLQELKESNQADRARWQGKEWDGEYKFYYFGARFFDPMFGLWTSTDPAGQFANPYSYGGDPVNYVDPNGEWVHIAIGAAVGAAMGAYQCVNSDASCARAMLVGAAVGAAAAWTGGAAGAALGESATGAAGLASQSGMVAAVSGGATEGAVSGAIAGTMSSSVNNAISRGGDWWKFNRSLGDDLLAGFYGGISGGLIGGATAGLQYGLSDAYQWQTHKTVLEYGSKNGRLQDAGRYAARQWGGDAERLFVVDAIPDAFGAEGRTIINNDEVPGYRKGDILVSKNIFNDPSNVYETVGHEVGHQSMGASSNFSLNREHLMIYGMERSSPYSKYWSNNVSDKLQENFMNHRAVWFNEEAGSIIGEWY